MASLDALEARLGAQEKYLEDLRRSLEAVAAQAKTDTKEILAAVNQTNLSVAVLPTWAHLKELQDAHSDRLETLESAYDQQRGGWKVIAAIASAASVIGGWVGSVLHGK